MTQMTQMKKSFDAKIKAVGDDPEEGRFVAYVSTWVQTPDSWGDVVAKGAFTRTIKEWKESGLTLSGLYGHNAQDPDYNIAYAEDIVEDDVGLRVEGRFDFDAPKARQVYRLVKGGRLSQMSFAFSTLDQGMVTLPDGTKANELRDVDIHEFSFVPRGANPTAHVADVKSGVAGGEKAGRVLAKALVEQLKTAYDAIGAVLEAAQTDEAPDDPPGDNGTPPKSGGMPEDHPAEVPTPLSDARARMLSVLHMSTEGL